MPVAKLTKSAIDAAKPSKRPYILWDEALKGFGCVIHPASPRHPKGARSYVVRYFSRSGRDRRAKLGRHGPLTPDHARRLALELLAQVAGGRDPLEERRTARSTPTVRVLFDRFKVEHLAKKKATTRAEVERIFEKVILPELGARKVGDVSRSDVVRLHSRYAEKPVTGNRILAYFSVLLTFAERVGERAQGTNPCKHVMRYPEKRRERFLSLEELGRLGKALDALGATDPDAAAQADVTRLALLTGGRRAEILGLRWEWIDHERKLIAYPDTKGGRVLRALGPHAVAILERQRARVLADCPWVFPHPIKPGEPRREIRAFAHDVLEEAKIADASLHTLRHTKATHAAELGYSELLIAAMLGHSRRSITAGYTHLSIDGATRTADEKVQAHLWRALVQRPAAEVIALAREAG